MPKILPWLMGGVFLALSFLLAVSFVKPIGVSTQFVIADAIVWDAINPYLIVTKDGVKKKYSSSNAYLNKSNGKYAKNAEEPLNYSFIFVLAMMFGAFLSSILKGDKPEDIKEKLAPEVWRERFGDNKTKRYIATFLAGFLSLYGARLAGGCTSGHMMSGIMQTALSGYLFTLGLFITSIPLAILIFKKK